ncbi:MAG: AtpZ/AtpI family protein [Limnochordia bacterium]
MKDGLKYFALITQVGVTLFVSVFIFTILGVHLDRRLGTNAIFTLVFVLLGCIAAVAAAVKLILDTLHKDSEHK